MDSLSIANLRREILPGPETLHELISCKDVDHCTAIEFMREDGSIQRISYAALRTQSSRLADLIRSKMTGSCETIIPVLLSQSPELYVAWVAVLQAGAAFCPVSPDTPQERLSFILKDTSAKIILTTSEHRSRHIDVSLGLAVLEVDGHPAADDRSVGSSGVAQNSHDVHILSTSTAYVMYTSGSTGVPKGVKVSHGSITQSLLAHDRHIPHFKKFLQFASPTFDVSVFETFFPMFRGATLATRCREDMLADLPGTINALQIDAAELTPTVAATLLRTRRAAPCLKILLTIGEMLTKHVIEEFGHSNEQEGILYAMYGPTEASVHCTIAPKLITTSSIRNIGKPLQTVTAFIISTGEDSAHRPAKVLPRGQSGELAVAGQLACGYLNRPDQTQHAFVPLAEYGTVYCTGDRARMLDSGELEIHGRLSDEQFKIRGQRAERGEIENIACKTPGVSQAVASLINDVLVLFCLKCQQSVTVKDVEVTCKSWLPRFMWPGDVVLLDVDPPRLPSGKIDRKGLDAQYLKRAIASRRVADDATGTGLERTIARCIAHELKCIIGITTPLWSSGLDSLQAIKIASQLCKKHIFLSPKELLEYDTVTDLAKQWTQLSDRFQDRRPDDLRGTETWNAIKKRLHSDVESHAHPAEVEDLVPCSNTQIALLAETAANRDLHFNWLKLHICGEVSPDQFRNAFRRLAQQNEILRSGFASTHDAEVPFVQIIWRALDLSQSLSLLHPLQLEFASEKTELFVTVRIHHALYDGWSWDLVLYDLQIILRGGQPAQRPQYRMVTEYHHQQKQHRSGHLGQPWRDQFTNASRSPFPNLCSRRRHQKVRNTARHTLSCTIAELSALARYLHISRQTIISAALALLLGSYSDTADIVFGVVMSGRALRVKDIQEIIGPCITTFPLHVNTLGVQTSQDLLLQVARSLHNLLDHDGTTLRDIKAECGLKPNETLFDTLFVWQEGPVESQNVRPSLRVVEAQDCLDYTCVIEAEPVDDAVRIKLTYEETKMPPRHAELFLSELDELIAALVKQGNFDLSRVWMWSSPDLLSRVNSNHLADPPNFDLTTNICRIAGAHPSRVALQFVQDFDSSSRKAVTAELTYGELYEQASALSGILSEQGIGPNDLVCISLDKSIDLYVLIAAITMTGAGYMCVDSRTPPDRVDSILRQGQCKLLIQDQIRCRDHCGNSLVRTTSIAELKSHEGQNCHGKTFTQDASSLAYAVFTSGTTGIPKGVLITRQNLFSNIAALSKIYPYKEGEDKLLQSCSPAFDVSVFEIFWTWHLGLTLCSATNDILFRDLEGLILAMNITHLSMTPSVAALIHPDNVPKVKMLVTAGEPMKSKVLDEWADRGLFQGYGPSETTNICNVRPSVSRSDYANNVGPPFSNTSIFICPKSLDLMKDGFQLLPRGAIGEIWIGGDQVGRGYSDATLTKQKFIETRYGRLYRSGDVGRLLANDDLVVLGRVDDQVKIRGQRVELSDISSVLTRNPAVRDATTIIIDNDNGNFTLTSFFSSPASTRLLPVEHGNLWRNLESQLPTYMIPDLLIPIREIPLTKQSKIDRRFLKQYCLELDASELSRCRRGGNDQDQDLSLDKKSLGIAQALSKVTGHAPSSIKANTSFFAAGLDSLSAIRFSRALKDMGFGQVDVSILMQHSTVNRLMMQMEKFEPSQTPSANKEARRTDLFGPAWMDQIRADYVKLGLEVEDIRPCTSMQEIMLAQSEMKISLAYQNEIELEVFGSLDRLKVAWTKVVSRHQILRTGFVLTNSTNNLYAQIVVRNMMLPWHDNKRPAVSDLAVPPFALHCLTFNDNRKPMLTLTIHHALYDAEAMALVLRDVEHTYHSVYLPAPLSFDRYIDYMIHCDGEKNLTFWHDELNGLIPTSLVEVLRRTPNLESPVVLSQETISLHTRVSLQSLQKSAQSYKATVAVLVQAAWGRLLACLFQSEDVCYGNVFSGRNVPVDDIENVVGPTFNTLPVRTQVAIRQTNKELVGLIQQSNVTLLPHQPSSLRQISRVCSARRERLFDSMVLFQQEQPRLDEAIWELKKERGSMVFPIVLEVIPRQDTDRITADLHVDAHTTTKAKAKAILESFGCLLEQIIEYPQGQTRNFDAIRHQLPLLNSGRAQGLPETPCSIEKLRPWQPFTETEIMIRKVITDLLGVEDYEIKADCTIFQLGFDSISAVQIAARLRKAGINVTGTDILENASIRQLSAFCDNLSQVKPGTSISIDLLAFESQHRYRACKAAGIKEANVQSIRPCTATQSGILAQWINSKGHLYFNQVVLQLDKEMNHKTLRQALAALAERHEILRTGFANLEVSNHAFAMITYRPDAHAVPWMNSQPDESASQARRAFERLHEPPWRVRLLRNASGVFLEIRLLHALYDAQTLDILLKDLADLYLGKALSPPTMIDDSLSHILSMEAGHDHNARQYWSDQCKDLQPSRFPNLNIHQDQSRKMSVRCRLIARRQREIEVGCQRKGVTLQALCQVTWARILAAYIGASRVSFGVILSGRHSSRVLADAAFPCMNTVPCAMTVTEDDESMLEAANFANIGRLKHQFTPLNRIKRWINLEEDAFDTVIVVQKHSSTQSNHHLWTKYADDASAEYVVSMEIVPDVEGKLELRLTFAEQVMQPAQADLLLRQFEEVLIDTIFKQGRRHDISWDLLAAVPAKDKRIETEIRYLHELVERTAVRTPNKTALEFALSITGALVEMKSWTYRQLDEQGNKIAHLLIQLGSFPGSLVGICFEKCPEASFAILGVLKSGCAYVAIDPGAPAARKQFMLKDAGCRVLLTTRTQILSMKEAVGILFIAVDEPNTWESLPEGRPVLSRSLSASDTCYCLYTSGTTGTPKGCLITHDSAVQAMMSFRRIFAGRWTEESRWLQFASFHFDVSVLEQYWSWGVGICVTSAPRDLLLEDLPRAIDTLRIDHLDLTPSLARLLKPEDVPRLCRGVFIVGGEQVHEEVLQAWGDVGCLYNFYGPSEVTIGCTVHRNVPRTARPSNIGQQWDNVGSFVLEPHSQTPVLRGAIGELCLSGPLVAKGYLHRPELTKEKFVNLTKYNVRVYRTGDLVRLLHDDSFDFVGRIDDQVKLRGQRLETAEINHVILGSSTEVKDAATIVAQHPKQSGKQLVALFTGGDQMRASPPEILFDAESKKLASLIRDHCKDHLPSYMVPTYILHVTSLPLSANNKADTRAFKSQFERLSPSELLSSSHAEERIDERGTFFTEKIIDVLAKFLQISSMDISPASRLFELGIDSISSIGLASLLRNARIGTIDPATILKSPTVNDLSRALVDSSRQHDGPGDEVARKQLRRFEDQQRDLHFQAKLTSVKSRTGDEILETLRLCVAKLAGYDLEDVRADSNIFQLGLDSIDSIRLSAMLKSEGLILPASAILRSETLVYLSKRARDSVPESGYKRDENDHSGSALQVLEVNARKTIQKQGDTVDGIERVLPTTPMQEGLLASYHKYYNFGLLELRAETDLRRLKMAWTVAVEHHPILRTSFTEIYDPDFDTAFAQIVAEKGILNWDDIELKDMNQVKDLIAEKKAAISSSGFRYPPLSITIVSTTSTGKRYQLLGMAHALYDAWALRLLHQDIVCFYHKREVRRPSYDKMLGRILLHESQESTSFWEAVLSSYIPQSFPILDGSSDSLSDIHLVMRPSSSDANTIQDFCKVKQISLQSFGLTCWAITLARYLRRHDTCFGLVLSGRTLEDASEIMFPTFNTVPFRITIPRDSTGSDLLEETHKFSLLVSNYQEFPLRKARKLCGSSQDLFDTLFLLQKGPSDLATDLPELYDQVELGCPTLDYPVNVEMQVGNNREVSWQVACKASLLSYEATHELVNVLIATAETLLSNPEERINIEAAEEPHINGNAHVLTTSPKASLWHENDTHNSLDKEMEEDIREVLALVARCTPEDILANTNYFTLGLDSMSAIKVASLLRRTKLVALPVSGILEAVTIENMTRVAKRLKAEDTSADVLSWRDASLHVTQPWDKKLESDLASNGIHPSAVEAVLLATPGQNYMLEMWKASSGRLFYNEFRWSCQGTSKEKLERATEILVGETAILRTTFVPYQNKTLAILLKKGHQSRVAAIFRTTEVNRQLILTLKIHHALYDAISLPKMMNRLEGLCSEQREKQIAEADIALSFIAVVRDPRTDRGRQHFWRTYLSNVATSGTKPARLSSFPANRIEAIRKSSCEEIALLTAEVRRAGVTLQSLFYTACANAYRRAVVHGTGHRSHDTVMGVYLANRGLDITGLEDVPFPTVNIVPLTVPIAEDLSAINQARQVQAYLAAVQRADHCGVSLQEVWQWTGIRLDFVVNFVKVPEMEQRSPSSCQVVQLEPVAPPSGQVSLEDRTSWPSPFSGGEPTVQPRWCLPTIDVEAKVDNDGALVIGVFAPNDLTKESQVRDLLDLIYNGLLDTSRSPSHGPDS